MTHMTKKGIVLSIILIILLLLIVINIILQDNKPIKPENSPDNTSHNEETINPNDKFGLYITEETGFNIDELKAYRLPIFVQCGSKEDETCKSMMKDLETLNFEMRGKAFVKYLDTDKYLHLLEENNFDYSKQTIQILFNSDGTPYISTETEAFGYKMIKNENEEHIYTIHRGELTLKDMKLLINSLIVK